MFESVADMDMTPNSFIPSGPVRVLLIEDSPADADFITETLSADKHHSFRVKNAGRLSAGISLAAQEPVDVILLDLSLPDGRGLSTVVHMREAAPKTPIVVLTGSDDEILWKNALEAGAQDYLVKGEISADGLVRSLKYAIVRKRLSDDLQDRERRLKEMDGLKNDFIQMITHELTTPIVAIAESLSVIEKEPDGRPQEKMEYLNIAQRHADRLIRLTSDLIDLVQMESGHFAVRPAQIDLRNLIETAARSFQKSARDRNIRLIHPDGHQAPPCPAFIDPHRFEQVLLNLLHNAFRFARAEVSIKIEEDRGLYQIIVEDDGPGIGPDDVHRIFEKFYRGRLQGKEKPGSGLGLAIVKNIVEAHGGTITAQNRAGAGGAQFTVTLPKSIPR